MARMLNQYPSNHPLSDRCKAEIRGIEDRMVAGLLKAEHATSAIEVTIKRDEQAHLEAERRNNRFYGSW